jgi:hypothetical protein
MRNIPITTRAPIVAETKGGSIRSLSEAGFIRATLLCLAEVFKFKSSAEIHHRHREGALPALAFLRALQEIEWVVWLSAWAGIAPKKR